MAIAEGAQNRGWSRGEEEASRHQNVRIMCLFNGFRCIHFRLAKPSPCLPASVPAQWQQKIMQRPQQKNSISCKLPTRTLRVICGRHAAAKRCGKLTTLQPGVGRREVRSKWACHPKGAHAWGVPCKPKWVYCH